MAVDKTKNTQVLVTIPNEMLEQIEKYWRMNGFQNRNQGIRKLIENALKEEK